MANELTLTTEIEFLKSNVEITKKGSAELQINVTGADAIHATMLTTGAAANIPKGQITTVGFIWCKNHDTTNYIEIGYDSTGFVAIIKLKPGEECIFRSAGQTLQAKADTSDCLMEYVMIED